MEIFEQYSTRGLYHDPIFYQFDERFRRNKVFMVLLFVFGLLDDEGELSSCTRKIFVPTALGQVSRSKTAAYIKSSFLFVSQEKTS